MFDYVIIILPWIGITLFLYYKQKCKEIPAQETSYSFNNIQGSISAARAHYLFRVAQLYAMD